MSQLPAPRHDRFAEIMAEMRAALVKLADNVGQTTAETIRDIHIPLDRPAIEATFRIDGEEERE